MRAHDGTPGGPSRTVTTRYVWMPHGGTSGWLLVHRSIERAGSSLEEFWLTGEISPDDATDVLRDSTEGWAPLVLGEPVNFLLWPYVLTSVSGKQLRKLREQLVLTLVRPLADITVEVTTTPDGPQVSDPVIVLADDPYAPQHADLALGDDWRAERLDPAERHAALLGAVEGRLELVRGRHHSVVVNRFVSSGTGPRPELDDVLTRRAVRAALAGVIADPAAEEARERLVDELRGHGWSFEAEPLALAGAPKPGFLERLVVLMVGDGDNAVAVRICGLPVAAAAMAGDEGLAAALTAYLCPLDPGLRPADRDFRAQLDVLPGRWDIPRERGLHLAPPTWDEVVTAAGDSPVHLGRREARLDLRHVELFDSQGLPSGKFDLEQTGEIPIRAPRP